MSGIHTDGAISDNQFSVMGTAWEHKARELSIEAKSEIVNFLYALHGKSNAKQCMFRDGIKESESDIKLGTELDKSLALVGSKVITELGSNAEEEKDSAYISVDDMREQIKKEKENKQKNTHTEDTRVYLTLQSTEDEQFIFSDTNLLVVNRQLKNDTERECMIDKLYKDINTNLKSLESEVYTYVREVQGSTQVELEEENVQEEVEETDDIEEESESTALEDTVMHINLPFVSKLCNLDFGVMDTREFRFARIAFTNKYTAKKLRDKLKKQGLKLDKQTEYILAKNYFLVYGDLAGFSGSLADSLGIPREYLKVVVSGMYKVDKSKYRLLCLGVGSEGLFSFDKGVYRLDCIAF